jgi:hypothetical protein
MDVVVLGEAQSSTELHATMLPEPLMLLRKSRVLQMLQQHRATCYMLHAMPNSTHSSHWSGVSSFRHWSAQVWMHTKSMLELLDSLIQLQPSL